MIDIHINKTGFSVMGHAEYAEKGHDIVCAGVSAITQTVAITLEEDCRAKIMNNTGGLFVELKESTSDTKILMKALVNGIRKIHEDYPKHVKIQIQRGM